VNKNNLLLLADFLEGLHQNEFNMSFYASDAHGQYQRDPQANVCNTVACAVGWGPSAGIPIMAQERDWQSYSVRAFGLSEYSNEWLWCFSGSWSRVDNSPAGAASRMRHLVSSGSAPSDAAKQSIGLAPYLFAESLVAAE